VRWGYVWFAAAVILGISKCGGGCEKDEGLAEATAFCESAPKADLTAPPTVQSTSCATAFCESTRKEDLNLPITVPSKSCVETYIANHRAEMKTKCFAKENVFSRLFEERPESK
jgi:hypothetical protein